jgi:hypothetical protein
MAHPATVFDKRRGATTTARRPRRSPKADLAGRIRQSVAVAEANGLLAGGRTVVVRGRMPAGLVKEAKRRTGIESDSKLLEAALAHVASEDDYGAWLVSQRGTVNADLDLEF